MLTVSCPHCQESVAADSHLAGHIVACPSCQRQFPLPLADPPLPSPPVVLPLASLRPVSRQPPRDNRPLMIATGITLAIVLVASIGIVINRSTDTAHRSSASSEVAEGTNSAGQRQTTPPLGRGQTTSDGERLPEVDLVGRTFSANHPDANARIAEAQRRKISVIQSGDKVHIGDVVVSDNPIRDYGGLGFGLEQDRDGTTMLSTRSGKEPLRRSGFASDQATVRDFLQRHRGAPNVKIERMTEQPYYMAHMVAEDGAKVSGIQHGRSSEEIQKSQDSVAEVIDAGRISVDKLERIGTVVRAVYKLAGTTPVRCDEEFLVLNGKVVYRFGSSREAILD